MFSFNWTRNVKYNKQYYIKPKQNLKFFSEFEEVYDKISCDLIQRIEELQEIEKLCQIADEFQEQRAKGDTEDISPSR